MYVWSVGLSAPRPLAFLDQVLHDASHNRRINHTHPEGRRDRPVETPATTRSLGLALSETARSWEMRSVAPAATVTLAHTSPISQRILGFFLPAIAKVVGGD